MERNKKLSKLTKELGWLQKNTNYILAGIFDMESENENMTRIAIIIPDIHSLIEGKNPVEVDLQTENGEIRVIDVRMLKGFSKNFYYIDMLNKTYNIILNPFINHILKANERFLLSVKSLQDVEIVKSQIQNIIHQMIYQDVLNRDIIASKLAIEKRKGAMKNAKN